MSAPPEFMADVAARAAWAALRRYGWLILLVMLADGGIEISARLLGDYFALLGTDGILSAVCLRAVQRVAALLAAASIYLLVMLSARGEPLALPGRLRRLASALPILLLAEAVFTLPSLGIELFMQDNPEALRFVGVAARVYQLGLLLTLGLAAPAILDRGLGLEAAIARSLTLVRGRRWPLFLMVAAPHVAMGLVRMGMNAIDPLRQLQTVWPLYLLNYAIYGFVLIAIAAVYVEATTAYGTEPDSLAETFD